MLAVVALLLAAGGTFLYLSYRAPLRSNAEKLLLSIEQIKVDQLLLWREDRVNSVLSILDGQPMRDTLRAFAADPAALKPSAVLRARLSAYIKRNKCDFAALTDSEGRVLLHAGGRPEEMCPQVASLIARAKISGRPELGDFYLSPGEGTPHIDVLAPATQAAGDRPLFLVLRVNPAAFLYPLLQTWSAKGETGEILLVGRSGDEVVFLNDLRHVSGAAMRLRRPLSAESLPAAMGLRGKSGIVEGQDYRGVPVLAAVGPVPGTNWALVTKMDLAEVLKGSTFVGILLALLALALLVSVGAGTFLLFRWHAKKTEEMLAKLTDQVPGVVYQYRLCQDGRSCFPYSSSGMEMIYEVTPDEVREDATPVFGRLHPDDLKSTSEAIFASARDLSIFHWEFRVVLPKQGLRWRLCDARPERTHDGGTLWYGIITDITDRKLAEEKTLKLNQELVRKNSEMENFLYITTHDLRSPLVNIQGFSQNLQRYLGEMLEAFGRTVLPAEELGRVKTIAGSKIPEALGFILESSAKMDLLLTALLKVSRMGRQELNPEPLDMDLLLMRILDAMRFQVDEAGADVKAGPLPPCRADAVSVGQLFSNLLDNSLKYRDPQKRLAVRISGEALAGKVAYRFSDNGPGIPEAALPRIWDVFYKPGLPGQNKGEGIGLPLVKRIAERNGGAVRVECKPGEGTVFTVELPAA